MSATPQELSELLVQLGQLQALEKDDPEQASALIQAFGFLVARSAEVQDNPAILSGISCVVACIRNTQDDELARDGIFALGRIKAVAGLDLLMDVAVGKGIALFSLDSDLDEEDSEAVQYAAVKALGQLNAEQAVVPLMHLLNDKGVSYRLRMAAAEGLGRLGDTMAEHIGHDQSDTVDSLVDILADEDESSMYLKESSAKALGMLGDIRAVDSLLNVLESRQTIRGKFDFLKERALEAIGRLMSQGNTSDVSGDDASQRMEETLLRALSDNAVSIRLAAVHTMAKTQNPQYIAALINVLRDKNRNVAFEAIAAIFQLGGDDALEVLRGRDDLSETVRDEIESYLP